MLKIKVTQNQIEYQQGQEKIDSSKQSFLQSYLYGQMQKDLGNEPYYLLILNEKEEIICSYLAILFYAKRGNFFFLPYIDIDQEKLNIVIQFLRDQAKELKVNFIRISPLMEENTNNINIFKELKFRNAPVHMMHPEILWLLNLEKNEKNLLSEMRKNNRYAIKQAEKLKVEVYSGNDQKIFEDFYNIHLETAQRQHFTPYSHNYFLSELKYFSQNDQIKVYIAKYQEKNIAAAIILFYGNEAIYHHGASLSEYNKIPGSYLIQWEAIKEAKIRGKKYYNFWGIVENAPKHPWAGLSFFKKGFGGENKILIHCQDLPLNVKYYFNFLIETFRRIKRGY